MSEILSISEISALEDSLEKSGLSKSQLMQLAGTHSALVAIQEFGGGPFLILCGSGNNGGDGWVCADQLAQRGYEVSIVSAVRPEEIKSDIAKQQALHAVEVGLPIYINPSKEEFEQLVQGCDCIIDAIVGTGFTSNQLKEPYHSWVEYINSQSFAKVLAIDVPSGMNAESGSLASEVVRANLTITMFALKPGFLCSHADEYIGELVIADIAPQAQEELIKRSIARRLTTKELAAYIPPLKADANKYSRGTVLVVAGSELFAGAAILAAQAAERSGAGYVRLALPQGRAEMHARAHLRSIPVIGLPANEDGTFSERAQDYLEALSRNVSCVLAGPGIGTGEGSYALVKKLLQLDCPLVLDADALNVLALHEEKSLTQNPYILRRQMPLVLTPHPKELSRLCKSNVHTQFLDRLKEAKELVWSVNSANFCVLTKGDMSAAVSIEGAVIPEFSSPSNAKAGSGDVLAGCLISLLAQAFEQAADTHVSLEKIGALASNAHALAAEFASDKFGIHGMNAENLVEYIGIALDSMEYQASEYSEEV